MGFSFSATAQCERCGEYLSDSDEECDHDGEKIQERMFRRIGSGEPNVVSIESTNSWKWYRLKDEMGEDWIAYEYLGPKEWVKKNVGKGSWETIADVPRRSMSIHAPDGVNEHGE